MKTDELEARVIGFSFLLREKHPGETHPQGRVTCNGFVEDTTQLGAFCVRPLNHPTFTEPFWVGDDTNNSWDEPTRRQLLDNADLAVDCGAIMLVRFDPNQPGRRPGLPQFVHWVNSPLRKAPQSSPHRHPESG